MLTKSDIAQIQKVVRYEVEPVKKDLKIIESSLRGEINLMRGEISVMREEHKQYRDEVLTKLDGIAGDIGMLKDENTIGSGQTSQLREEIENHETRIKNLEKISQTA